MAVIKRIVILFLACLLLLPSGAFAAGPGSVKVKKVEDKIAPNGQVIGRIYTADITFTGNHLGYKVKLADGSYGTRALHGLAVYDFFGICTNKDPRKITTYSTSAGITVYSTYISPLSGDKMPPVGIEYYVRTYDGKALLVGSDELDGNLQPKSYVDAEKAKKGSSK